MSAPVVRRVVARDLRPGVEALLARRWRTVQWVDRATAGAVYVTAGEPTRCRLFSLEPGLPVRTRPIERTPGA